MSNSAVKRFTCEILQGPTNGQGVPIAIEEGGTLTGVIRAAAASVDEGLYAGPFCALAYRNAKNGPGHVYLVEGAASVKEAADRLLALT